MNPIYPIVSEKFSFKNSKFYKECMLLSCNSTISQFSMADISFNNNRAELKIAQIAKVHQFFPLLNLVRIYGHGFDESSRMLMRNNVNNDVSKGSPIVQFQFRKLPLNTNINDTFIKG